METTTVGNKKIGNGLDWIGIILAAGTLFPLWFVFQSTLVKAMQEESVGLIYLWDALAFLAFFSSLLSFVKLKKGGQNKMIAIVGMSISLVSLGFCIAATMGIIAIQRGVEQALN